MGFLGKIRRWVDGEEGEDSLEKASENAKPRGAAQEFIVKLAREVEAVMRNEMVPLPQGTVIIPTEYIIFLSEEDDREWTGAKRRGLEQGLFHVLADRAKEMAGKNKLEVKSFSVELRVDGTLEKNEIRVQHTWDDTSSGKTSVAARKSGSSEKIQLPQNNPPNNPPINNSPIQPVRPPIQPPPSPHNNPNQMQATQPFQVAVHNLPPLVTPQPSDDENETEAATVVQRRTKELYKLEVWQNGQYQVLLPVFKPEISIGRGSKSVVVDIPLKGDPEISRLHVVLERDFNGNFWLNPQGKNPIVVGSMEIPGGQKTAIANGASFSICSYALKIVG